MGFTVMWKCILQKCYVYAVTFRDGTEACILQYAKAQSSQ